jgi:hypothetical protein
MPPLKFFENLYWWGTKIYLRNSGWLELDEIRGSLHDRTELFLVWEMFSEM